MLRTFSASVVVSNDEPSVYIALTENDTERTFFDHRYVGSEALALVANPNEPCGLVAHLMDLISSHQSVNGCHGWYVDYVSAGGHVTVYGFDYEV